MPLPFNNCCFFRQFNLSVQASEVNINLSGSKTYYSSWTSRRVLRYWLEAEATKMHSSRMHTDRCSGCLSCHAHPLPHMPPPCHACPPPAMHTALPHRAPFAMHTSLCHTCPPLPCTHHGQIERRLWKHYLSATTVETTVADGKKKKEKRT